MKRFLALSLTLLALFMLCSCIFDPEPVPEPTTDQIVTEIPTEPAPLTEISETSEPEMAEPVQPQQAQPVYRPQGGAAPAQTPRTAKSKAPCDHSWQPANCRSPQTCSKCGATQGYVDPNGHHFVGNVCSICGRYNATYTTARAQTTVYTPAAATTTTAPAETSTQPAFPTLPPETQPTQPPTQAPTQAPTQTTPVTQTQAADDEFIFG